jgi:hypothetical protein
MEGINTPGHPPKEGGWSAAIQRLDNAFRLIATARATASAEECTTLTEVAQQGLVMLGLAKDAEAGRAALSREECDETQTAIANFCQAVEEELGAAAAAQGAPA